MNIADLDNVFTSLQPVNTRGGLTEELRDLTVRLAISLYNEAELTSLMSQVYQHPRVLRDCSIDVQRNGGSDHLLRITRRGVLELQEETFQRIGEETDVDGPDYERQLSGHSTHGRETQLIQTVVDLLVEIERDTAYTVDCPVILDKQEIGRVIVDNATVEGIESDAVDLQFWFDVENLRSWLANRSFTEYGSRLFSREEIPVLVYFQNAGGEIEGTSLFPVFQLTDDIVATQGAYQTYRERMSLAGENTTFRSGAPVITPAVFAASTTLAEVFQTAMVYAVFAVFSDRVTSCDGSYEFYMKHGPKSLRSVVDIDQAAAALTDSQLADLCELYQQDFADREDRATFVGFWRRSAVQQCDDITDLPTAVATIRDHYHFIEAETVEGNFDDLSDAVRDTHAFMTDITSQVADTIASLSNEIQRLVFTLLGAVLANLFLILRWGNIDMVIPFSLFVIGAILVFYFPLIDRRIEELDEIKSKGEEDYKTYDDLITGFTGEVFDFIELRKRKDEYMEYADERLDWGRRILRRLHTVLLFLGLGFVVLATALYPTQSSQVVLAAVFVAVLGYLAIRVYTTTDSHSYYRISLPTHDPEDAEDPDDLLYPNHLPAFIGIVSLVCILVNALTSVFPL